jgi:hypothetical protein
MGHEISKFNCAVLLRPINEKSHYWYEISNGKDVSDSICKVSSITIKYANGES